MWTVHRRWQRKTDRGRKVALMSEVYRRLEPLPIAKIRDTRRARWAQVHHCGHLYMMIVAYLDEPLSLILVVSLDLHIRRQFEWHTFVDPQANQCSVARAEAFGRALICFDCEPLFWILKDRFRKSTKAETRILGFSEGKHFWEMAWTYTLDGRSYHLNDGSIIPALGLGTGGAMSRVDTKQAVLHALHAGYRHLDCSPMYGNEAQVGEALKEFCDSGVCSRADVFITSKLPSTAHDPADAREAIQQSLRWLYERVQGDVKLRQMQCRSFASVSQSRWYKYIAFSDPLELRDCVSLASRNLGLDYLDLYLIHWPVKLRKESKIPPKEEDFLPLDLMATWQAMEDMVDRGFVRSIGVSNFSCKKLEDVLSFARIAPAVNQVEMHPGWNQRKLTTLCRDKLIHVTAYSPLGAPRLGYGRNDLISNRYVLDEAKRLDKTAAQILIRWGLQQGVSVIPKSSVFERILENQNVWKWSISDETLARLATLEQSRQLNVYYCNESTSPYKKAPDLWDGEVGPFDCVSVA